MRRATQREMTSTDGRHPPGKMCVRMKLLDARSTAYARSSIVIDCRSIAPSGASRSAQRSKNVPKSFQPTASTISIETSLSYCPRRSR